MPEVVALGVGLLTLVVSVLSYRLQKKFTQQTFDLEKKRDEAAKQQSERLEAQAKRQIPDNISLGDEILIMPTMKEAGIPESLVHLGIFEHPVEKGEWVNRGDVLVTVRYEVFANWEKPRWRIFDDERFTTEVSLRSPVSGLVISYKKETARSSDWFAPVIVFPVILLPRKEPPPDQWVMSFYNDVNDKLRQYWPRIAHRESLFYRVRLKEKFPDLDPQLNDELRLADFEIRKLKPADKDLLNEIQRLRANPKFPELHTKLAHLIP